VSQPTFDNPTRILIRVNREDGYLVYVDTRDNVRTSERFRDHQGELRKDAVLLFGQSIELKVEHDETTFSPFG
jgi:hypothetical protein